MSEDDGKEYWKAIKEIGFGKSEDEPLTEQELRQIFIYNKILEGEKTRYEILTTKIEELNKTINEKKLRTEDKIKENPLAYMAGAFIGGLVTGFLIRKGQTLIVRNVEKQTNEKD